MPTPADIVRNFILPALIVAGALALGWIPCPPRRGKPRNGRWIGVLAVSAAFAVADTGISGVPRWPPGSGGVDYWIIWFTLPIGLLGLLDAWLKPPLWLRAAVLLLAAHVIAYLLLSPLAAQNGSSLLPQNAAICAATVIFWLAWENMADRFPGPAVPILLTLFLAASGGILALANDIKPSQAALAMTGIAAVAVFAAWLWPQFSLVRGAILAWIIPLMGLLILVHYYYYTEPPAAAVVLLFAAPFLAFLADLPPARRLTVRRRLTLRILPVLVALSGAVGLSAWQFLRPPPTPTGHSAAQSADE